MLTRQEHMMHCLLGMGVSLHGVAAGDVGLEASTCHAQTAKHGSMESVYGCHRERLHLLGTYGRMAPSVAMEQLWQMFHAQISRDMLVNLTHGWVSVHRQASCHTMPSRPCCCRCGTMQAAFTID
jgi:hypothetical protein